MGESKKMVNRTQVTQTQEFDIFFSEDKFTKKELVGGDPMKERMETLIVKIAEANCDPRMSGPDGTGYGYAARDYPEAAGGFGNTQLEAAIEFLEEFYL